ncbi:hypothetical protein M8J77_024824 [Diaphorina citri]|nr:hypothetical protein M8J77_024824 [Diaphorina citri]
MVKQEQYQQHIKRITPGGGRYTNLFFLSNTHALIKYTEWNSRSDELSGAPAIEARATLTISLRPWTRESLEIKPFLLIHGGSIFLPVNVRDARASMLDKPFVKHACTCVEILSRER